MAHASPYFRALRKNEAKGRNFARFTSQLGAEPKHLYGDIIEEKNWAGATLLFEALNHGAPVATVLDLIERYPKACTTKLEVSGQPPISLALQKGAPLPVVESLMAHIPIKSLKRNDVYGKLFLVALRGGCPDEVAEYWLHRFPKAATYKSGRYKVLPLLVALELKRSAHLVSAILGCFPDAARYPDPSGRLPLHAALEASAPLSVLQALAAAYPRALNMPVHSAVPPAGAKPPPKLVLDGEGDNNDDDDNDGDDEPAPTLVAVTNAAVSQNTAAASDSHAPTTTHAVPHANSGEGPWDTRGTALRQEGAAAVAGTGGVSGGAGSRSGNNTAPGTRPQSPSPGGGGGASTKSKDPDRCLHLALRCGAADAVVSWLFQASGCAAHVVGKRDSSGHFPLQLALMQRAAGPPVLDLLLHSAIEDASSHANAIHPVLARTPDGKTTLVLAIECAAPSAFLCALLDAQPAAATVPSPSGLFPLMLAVKFVPDHSAFLSNLLNAAPAVPSVLVRDSSGVRPFFVPAQQTKDLDPTNPDALPLVEAATTAAQQELRLKRHSAAGYLPPAASAAAAAVTSTTSVLHEALIGCRSEHGAVFLLQRLLPLTPVGFLEVRSGDEQLIPLHLALLNRRLGRATMPVLQQLLDRCPDAAGVLTGKGLSPYQLAVRSHAPAEVQKRLGSLFPNLVHRPSMPAHANLLTVAEPRRNNEPSSNSQAHAIALLARGLPRGQWQLRYNKPKQDGNNNASGSNRSGASASNSSGSSSGNQSIIQKPGSDFELKKVRRVPSRL